MIEHRPSYQRKPEGFNQLRIALVGYSHHRHENDPDGNAFTENVITNVISGEQTGDTFFPTMRFCFDAYDDDFWESVTFFNFLPDCIGTSKDKLKVGTQDQIKRAQSRFLRVLEQGRFDKVFIFTMKGWRNRPPTSEELAGTSCKSLDARFAGTQLANAEYGSYVLSDGHITAVCGFRHPMYTKKHLLREAAQAFLNLP